MKNKKVEVIILNFNGFPHTIECIESVRKISYPNYEIIICDNNSSDNSLKEIINFYRLIEFETKCQDKVKNIFYSKEKRKDSSKNIVLIALSKNLGFGGGNNAAIQYTLKENFNYFLLLNNDTVVDKNFLEPMVRLFEEQKNVGAVGAIQYNYYDKEKIEVIYNKQNPFTLKNLRFNSMRGQNSTPYIETSYVEGACFLTRKDVIEKAGLLCEDYFFYWEELDWCDRMRKAGYNMLVSLEAKIWHKVMETIKKNPDEQTYFYIRSKFIYAKRNMNFIKRNIFYLSIGLYLPFYLVTS
jgi:GT2 family glycosyltransferase